MKENVNIRSRVSLGETGDLAEVRRVVKVSDQVYVEVEQTGDAREPTIMVAVNKALQKFEGEHGEEKGIEEGAVEEACIEGQG